LCLTPGHIRLQRCLQPVFPRHGATFTASGGRDFSAFRGIFGRFIFGFHAPSLSQPAKSVQIALAWPEFSD